MRSIFSALGSVSAIATIAAMAGRGVARTLNVTADVLDVLLDAAGRVVRAPLAILSALKQSAFPVPEAPVAPAQAAANEVMSALEEARRKGPEQILTEGQTLLDHVAANPARKVQYDANAALKAIRDAKAKAEAVLARSSKKGWEASTVTHWARARVDGIAPDPTKGDLRLLPEHLQIWARSLTPEQVAEVARMPRQHLHHHLTADDHKLWNAALPAASLDTAKRAMHGIRTAVKVKLDGIADPHPQQKALDGIARRRELDAFRDVEPLPVAPRI